MSFKKGMKVKKIFKGIGGFREETEAVVGKVSKGVVYLSDGQGGIETGVTYNMRGKEIENFFLPMTSEIIPLGSEQEKK